MEVAEEKKSCTLSQEFLKNNECANPTDYESPFDPDPMKITNPYPLEKKQTIHNHKDVQAARMKWNAERKMELDIATSIVDPILRSRAIAKINKAKFVYYYTK